MHRIDTPTAQADKFGQGKNGFTNGDPATGRRATDLNSDMWDAVQEEICTAIESAGITLDKTKHDQLYQAIVKIITSKIPDALLRNNNLSDVVDKALARANLELKSAATADVQKSRDDVTAGRVLVNGGAIALRSVAASADRDIKDASGLPANSVSFCYASAANSPGYEATILDVGGLGGDGYRVQYAASYADGGKQLKFRTLNADNGHWGAWTSVITSYGGNVDYIDGATYYGTNTNTWAGCGGFADQYNNGIAPFLHRTYTTPKNASIYLPLIKGISQTEYYGFGAAVSFGILRSGSNDFGSAIVHIIGDNGSAATYGFGINGTFNAPGQLYSGVSVYAVGDISAGGNIHSAAQVSSASNIVAGQGLYESGGLVRVYSSNNPPPQQDLSPYATTAWVNGEFISSARRGGQVYQAGSGTGQGMAYEAPAGCFLTGINTVVNDGRGMGVYYRALQVYIPSRGYVQIGD